MRAGEQAYRDPIHDFITITDGHLRRIIDTPEFQRLRRIRQLGASFGTYHGAEHSRFGHSLGAMWIMQRILDRFRHSGMKIDEGTYLTALCAALLHDIGHGPFSHALEKRVAAGVPHEVWSAQIVLGDTEINRLLRQIDASLPDQVAAILTGTFTGPRYVAELVSSQLDVDRMDYLIRDSLYTGVTYGRFDLQRVINTLTVVDERVVVAAKGVVAIEEYVLARYFMYWQVYLHKTTRSQEWLLKGCWQRAKELVAMGEMSVVDSASSHLRPFLLQGKGENGSGSGVGCGDSHGGGRGELEGQLLDGLLHKYLAIDDYDLIVTLKSWRSHKDKVLADLAARFLDRRLLKPVFKVPHEGSIEEGLDAAREVVAAHGWDPDYYLVIDHTTDVPYDVYTVEEGDVDDGVGAGVGEGVGVGDGWSGGKDAAFGVAGRMGSKEHKPPILALDEFGRVSEIASLSTTIRAVAQRRRQAVNIYVPSEVLAPIRSLFMVQSS
ncbi:MAG TPA: HD domain-containing protein [Firmicutes bacterium]|nr:HD domain-containing protein [Bacillota bacterium]